MSLIESVSYRKLILLENNIWKTKDLKYKPTENCIFLQINLIMKMFSTFLWKLCKPEFAKCSVEKIISEEGFWYNIFYSKPVSVERKKPFLTKFIKAHVVCITF